MVSRCCSASTVGNVTLLPVLNAQPGSLHEALHSIVRADSQDLLFGVVIKQLSCILLEKKMH